MLGPAGQTTTTGVSTVIPKLSFDQHFGIGSLSRYAGDRDAHRSGISGAVADYIPYTAPTHLPSPGRERRPIAGGFIVCWPHPVSTVAQHNRGARQFRRPTATRSATPASPWASRRAPSRPSACLPGEPSSTSQAAYASRSPRPATSPRERHPSSPLVETTFTQVRVVVQTDQQPRSRIGERHGVFAVLVTVVHHPSPAAGVSAGRTCLSVCQTGTPYATVTNVTLSMQVLH